MKVLTDELFADLNLDKKPYIILFETKNCPNCKTVREYLKQINTDKLKPCYFDIYIVNSDENKILTELFLLNNGIRAYPTTFFVKNGKATSIIGAKKIGEYITNIKKICEGEKKTLYLKLIDLKNKIFYDED